MGNRKPEMTIERIDNTKGYYPENCRWGTRTQQARNRRNTLMTTHEGNTLAVAELAEILGVKYHTLRLRLLKSGKIA